jgi:hypothetical protein
MEVTIILGIVQLVVMGSAEKLSKEHNDFGLKCGMGNLTT